MLKIVNFILLLSFISILTTIVGMNFGDRHFWKEIHPISGSIFITFIFIHIYLNRNFFFAQLRKKKNNPNL